MAFLLYEFWNDFLIHNLQEKFQRNLITQDPSKHAYWDQAT